MSNAHECTFGERLEKLMVEDGIDIAKKKGADTELASRMLARGCLSFYVNEYYQARNSARTQIGRHRNAISASSLEGKWLKAYCDYFNCSADYLFGYIDLPTHADTDIQKETGLSADSINFLKAHKTIYPPVLNKLFHKANFQYAIFHTGKFWDKLAELSSAEEAYHTGLKEMDAYSEATGGNYIGEPESVSAYHKLQEECEHQEYQAIKYFNTLLSELGNKLNFRSNS